MAGPNVEILQLEAHDDIVSIRDQLAFVNARRVLLVWPRRGQILQRKLDLVLLQREVKRRGMRVALITNDLRVVDHARELDISVFGSIEESERQRWKRGSSEVFTNREQRPQPNLDPDGFRDSASRLSPELTPSQIALRQAARRVGFIVIALFLCGALYIFLPSATVTLTPARERLDVTIRIIADPSTTAVDLDNGMIPAQVLRIEVEESAVVDASGRVDAEPTLARGLVVFTNQTEQAAIIPAGTTVATSTGSITRFRTIDSVGIDGQTGAIAAVTVEALPEFAGPQGNVRAFAIDFIDGPLNELLTVQNPEPLSGGSDPDYVTVSRADHDRLLAAVRQAIQQRALGDLTPMIGVGQEIIPETIGIVEERPEWTTYSAQIGEEASEVSLSMRAAVQATVIDMRHVNQAAFAGLTRRLPENRIVVPDSMTFARTVVEATDQAGRAVFLTNVTSSVIVGVEIDDLQNALAGRSMDDALVYLQNNLELQANSTPIVTVWPEFFPTMPVLSSRIQVIVQELP